MELNSKKGVGFTLDAFVSILIVIMVFSSLPYLIRQDSENAEILLMKRHSDSILTALDNSGELDKLLFLNENQGKILITENLNSMLDSKYNYNVYVVIDSNNYIINNGLAGNTAVVSRRLFFDLDISHRVKRGYIELEVWRV